MFERASCILLVIFVIAPASAAADGTLVSWSPQTLIGMTQERWNAAKKRSVEDILTLNAKSASWPETYEIVLGADQHKGDMKLLRGLVRQLTDQSEVKLKHTSGLIIWERIVSGDVFFEGKGLQVEDDLFTVAGRANWILRAVAGKRLGVVRPRPSAESLRDLQSRWTMFLDGKQVEEIPEKYSSDQKGLEELRSPIAVNALIHSLQPSDRKNEFVKKQLSDLYGLKELPKDPESPARFCNPDAYAHNYLARITNVSQRHAHEWWMDWWAKNKDQLVWNEEQARFETGP